MPQGKPHTRTNQQGASKPLLMLARLLARQAAVEQIAAAEAHKPPSSSPSSKEEIGHDKSQN